MLFDAHPGTIQVIILAVSSSSKFMLVPSPKIVLAVVTTAVVTTAVFYLTPLRHLSLVEPRIDDISATEFYEQWKGNEDEYIFIDVRGAGSYDRLHAAGSQLMPLHTLYNERHNLPKSGKTIVLICSGGVASGVGYGYLEHYGFLNLKRIDGGIEAWHGAGLPVEGSAVQIFDSSSS